MKAIRVNAYGTPEVLRLEQIATPLPGPGEALVRIAVVGVNFTDIYRRLGVIPVNLPYTPGMEASGTVEAIGDGVTYVKPGDRVAFAYSKQMGAYAEFCVSHAASLFPLPADISFEQGAAFPLQGTTAHYLLYEFRHLKPGEVVLIHAAAGGMGLLLVQWARRLGATVLGTVSTDEKARIAREAGAHEVIVYSREDFVSETKRLTHDRGADLIIDGVGKTTFRGNLEAAALRGNIVIYGSASGPAEPIAPNSLMPRSLTVSGGSLPNYLSSRDELLRRGTAVIEAIRGGWLRLRIDRILPLAQAAEAHRLLASRQTIGKLLLCVGES
jgi:NADPH:quinone reductase